MNIPVSVSQLERSKRILATPIEKKVLLVRHKTSNTLNLNTSYSLALLSAVLEPLVDVKILDNNGKYKSYSDKDILDYIKSFKPDIIGFNVFMYNAYNSYKLIKLIKTSYPEIPLLVGGVHTHHCSHEIIEMPVIVVKGEAEITLPKLIKKLSETYFQNNKRFDKNVYTELSKVRGIVFRNDNGDVIDTGPADIVQNLDELPFISHRKYNLEDFIKTNADNIGSTNSIITQRGCPYTCIYCKSAYMTKVREASPAYAVRYIEYLYSKFGYHHMYFMDENFTLRKRRVLEFCQLFVKSGLHKKVTLECQTNVLCPLNEDILSAMAEANFLRIQFGIDRLTEEGVRKAKIRHDNKLLRTRLELLKSKNIKTFFCILLGMDFDDADSIRAEYEEVQKFKDLTQVISVGAVLPVPGTELFARHPEVERWYLRKDFNEGDVHYYDLALAGSKAVDLNLFNLPKHLLRQIVATQLRARKITILNIFGEKGLFIYYPEKTLILFSYYLSRIAPRLEIVIFKPIKILREYLVRIAYDLFYYAK